MVNHVQKMRDMEEAIKTAETEPDQKSEEPENLTLLSYPQRSRRRI